MKPTTCSLDFIPRGQRLFDTVGPSILLIMNSSLKSGIFPHSFKHAVLLPIFKKPNLDPSVLNNFMHYAFIQKCIPTGFNRQHHIIPVLVSRHWIPVRFRIDFKIVLITFKVLMSGSNLYNRHFKSLQASLQLVEKLKVIVPSLSGPPWLWNALSEEIQSFAGLLTSSNLHWCHVGQLIKVFFVWKSNIFIIKCIHSYIYIYLLFLIYFKLCQCVFDFRTVLFSLYIECLVLLSLCIVF